jgi:RHS repeat-associated protein
MYRHFIVVILVLLAITVEAQQISTTGFPPFSTFDTTLSDSINLANLNIHFSIPLRQSTARNLPLEITLDNDNNFITCTNQCNGGWIRSTSDWGASTNVGFGAFYDTSPTQACPNNPQILTQVYSNFRFLDGHNTYHYFGTVNADTQNCTSAQQLTGFTTDGTQYYIVLTHVNGNVSYSVTDVAGNVYAGTTKTDPNGNTLLGFNGFTDASGNKLLTMNRVSNLLTQYSYTGPGANFSPMFQVNRTAYTLKTAFGCGLTPEESGSGNLVTSITFPDGSAYAITYEQTPGQSNPSIVTGRIGSIKLPTGGTITYNYTGPNNGINCLDGGTAGVTRTTPDGQWTYSRSYNTTTKVWTTTVFDPPGNKTVYTFSGASRTGTTTFAQFETQRQIYELIGTTQTLRKTVVRCYSGNFANCANFQFIGSAPPTRVDAYIYLPGISQPSLSEQFYNGQLLTQDNEYDFGVNTGAAPTTTPLKATKITYATIGLIRNRPSCVQVTAGSSPATCGTVTSTTNSITKYLNYDAHGNVGTVQQWVSGSAFLSRSYTYYPTGLVQVATDVNGAQTTNTYGACNSSFPTLISEPLGLSKTLTWDCVGEVITSIHDENSQPTQYSYFTDPFWRVLSMTDPAGAVTTTCYGSISSGSCVSNRNQIETVMSFNSGASVVDKLITTDGMGRQIISQTRQGPTAANFDTVSTTYDIDGRVASVSVPCVKTASLPCPTTPATTTTYDGLSRPQLVTDAGGGTTTYGYSANDVSVTIGPGPTSQRQMEYDSLGRLTSVCEVTANTLWPPGTCAQKTPLTGYWTKYTYNSPVNSMTMTQNAQGSPMQTRSYAYDGVGRLTSETNPEWNSLATTYTYDTDTTCGTSNGDLVKKLDPAGNVTCTTFDGLHRPTGSTYPSGPNASLTAAKYFQYDNQYFGSTGTNIKGRLVAAATCQSPTSCAGNSVVLEEFGYSARGELTDIWEITPHSAGTYHITSSYWPNGQLNTLQGVSLPTLTYGLDGEGRPKTVSASTGINPVFSTAYNSAGQATNVTFGSSSGPGDPVDFGFDPNTGSMTQYKLTINGTATHGDPAWNPNGTLGSLAITDPFNAADAQTCTYGYDDTARLASVNCLHGTTNVWNQNFTYDPFGNITKSGTISWQPGYNQSTNQYLTSANCATTGAAPCYDADGNLLKDGTDHVYTWDADGHPVTLDSDNLVYDAFGREVEVFKSGAYTEFVFGPTGKLALMNGQTQTKAFVALPGGTQVKYAGSAISTYRLPDWLGSFRVGSNPNRTYSWGVAFAPFGEQYAVSGGAALSFTGEEGTADTVSDEYDFLFRKLHSAQGRWISPDPAGLSAADLTNPQSWNLYAYVLNNPLLATDPNGLDCVYLNNGADAVESIDHDSNFDECTGPDANGNPNGGFWVPGTVASSSWVTDIDMNLGAIGAYSIDPTYGVLFTASANSEYGRRSDSVIVNTNTSGSWPSGYPTLAGADHRNWFQRQVGAIDTWMMNHDSALSKFACAVIPGGVNDIHSVAAQLKGNAAPRPNDSTDGTNQSALWTKGVFMPNANSTKAGSNHYAGEGSIANSSAALASGGVAAAVDYANAAAQCAQGF